MSDHISQINYWTLASSSGSCANETVCGQLTLWVNPFLADISPSPTYNLVVDLVHHSAKCVTDEWMNERDNDLSTRLLDLCALSPPWNACVRMFAIKSAPEAATVQWRVDWLWLENEWLEFLSLLYLLTFSGFDTLENSHFLSTWRIFWWRNFRLSIRISCTWCNITQSTHRCTVKDRDKQGEQLTPKQVGDARLLVTWHWIGLTWEVEFQKIFQNFGLTVKKCKFMSGKTYNET